MNESVYRTIAIGGYAVRFWGSGFYRRSRQIDVRSCAVAKNKAGGAEDRSWRVAPAEQRGGNDRFRHIADLGARASSFLSWSEASLARSTTRLLGAVHVRDYWWNHTRELSMEAETPKAALWARAWLQGQGITAYRGTQYEHD